MPADRPFARRRERDEEACTMRRVTPFLLGGVAALAGAALASLAVKPLRVWESGAFAAGPEAVLVVVAAVVAGVLATFFAWRAIVGPPIEHVEWTLLFAPPPPAGAAPDVEALLRELRAAGYSPDARLTDEAGEPAREAPAGSALPGATLELTERGVDRRHGRLVLRIPPPPAAGESGLGFVDAYGALDGAYDEMGRFAIAALSRLFPALAYKRLDSSLGEEPASSLHDELPSRAERLATLARR
jgi:hypothetical protein